MTSAGTHPTAASGWPFAVGAGRHADYRVVAAPDVLVEAGDHGALGDAVVPVPAGSPPRQAVVTTGAGARLTVVFSTHDVLRGDLRADRGPEATDAAPDDASPARDEQNRPLRLVFGFVVLGDWRVDPDPADLESARRLALAAYRRFLADETARPVTASRRMPLHSHLLGRTLVPPAAPRPAAPRPAASRPASRPPVSRPAAPSPRALPGTVPGVARIAAVVLVAAAALVLWLTRSPDVPPQLRPSPPASVVTTSPPASVVTPSPSSRR